MLVSFRSEDDPGLSLAAALPEADEFVGTFQRLDPKPTLVEAYSGLIENEDTQKSYRIVALVDVTERERAQRDKEKLRQLAIERCYA